MEETTMKRVRYLKYSLLLLLPIFLGGCRPIVTITSPQNGEEFEFGQEITFSGSATDLQDENLTGNSLVWASDKDGQIGIGTEFTRDDFSQGTHVITLTATNSQGVKGVASITISIGGVPTTSTTTTSISATTSTTVLAEPDPETDNFTWTLPTGASPLRLSLPADIDDFLFDEHGGIGGYGLHAGAHIEGLDHVWIELKPGTPVKSWADGMVKAVNFYNNPEGGEYHISIDYGQNLTGTHMEIITPYVEEGDHVNRGQEIGMGMSMDQQQSSAEMDLVDKGRTDGVEAWGGGVHVSPFDYLRDSEKLKLIDAYKKQVIEPYVIDGTKVWGFEPYQPYLTNKLFLHEGNEAKLTGAWYLISSDWEYGYPNDLLTLIEAENPYYKGNVAKGMDDSGGFSGDWFIDGIFEVDYQKGQVKITDNYHGPDYYGIFEIDESSDRAKLKIEYQESSYPTGFSSNALTYIQRSNVARREDAAELGVLNE
jgi:murein DD-endopeptidase MepM/ murein hydrolase activator NlpD